MGELSAICAHLGTVVIDLAPCPTCGIPPELWAIAERKRALDEALARCEQHLVECSTCRGWGGPYCGTMEKLREKHFDAWLRYHGAQGSWNPGEELMRDA